MNILEKIIEQKKLDLQKQKKYKSLKQLIEETENYIDITPATSLYHQLSQNKINIIAEIKRYSPSKGALNQNLIPSEIGLFYERNGACAISVLTEENFFKGHLSDLIEVKKNVNIPILRKDFIIDEYQVWEAKLAGAKAILLIAGILNKNELMSFMQLSQKLELDVLMEVHDENETIKALEVKPNIIGINNRNLKTFSVNINNSLEIITKFKTQHKGLWVSESGIESRKQITSLREAGFNGFLIGESLLKTGYTSLEEKFKEYIN